MHHYNYTKSEKTSYQSVNVNTDLISRTNCLVWRVYSEEYVKKKKTGENVFSRLMVLFLSGI